MLKGNDQNVVKFDKDAIAKTLNQYTDHQLEVVIKALDNSAIVKVMAQAFDMGGMELKGIPFEATAKLMTLFDAYVKDLQSALVYLSQKDAPFNVEVVMLPAFRAQSIVNMFKQTLEHRHRTGGQPQTAASTPDETWRQWLMHKAWALGWQWWAKVTFSVIVIGAYEWGASVFEAVSMTAEIPIVPSWVPGGALLGKRTVAVGRNLLQTTHHELGVHGHTFLQWFQGTFIASENAWGTGIDLGLLPRFFLFVNGIFTFLGTRGFDICAYLFGDIIVQAALPILLISALFAVSYLVYTRILPNSVRDVVRHVAQYTFSIFKAAFEATKHQMQSMLRRSGGAFAELSKDGQRRYALKLFQKNMKRLAQRKQKN